MSVQRKYLFSRRHLFTHNGGFSAISYLIFILIVFIVAIFCICNGSANISGADAIAILIRQIKNTLATVFHYPLDLDAAPSAAKTAIILNVRLPRVLCVAAIGGALSLCGAAMQGLLKNPLADGSTLGVSAGASLGAVLAIAFGVNLPFFQIGGAAIFSTPILLAIIFAFLSLLIIITFAYAIDRMLSTNTIILIGIIYSMFTSSTINIIYTLVPEKVKDITFWTMGSVSGSNYQNFLVLLIAILIFGTLILLCAREINAFAIGEDNARSIGIPTDRVRLLLLICVAVLIGISVALGGMIAFVGLITPHLVRLITGSNHQKLLPASLFCGAIFLMLADLFARTIARPLELPIGAITSFIGAILFVLIFYRSRKSRR